MTLVTEAQAGRGLQLYCMLRRLSTYCSWRLHTIYYLQVVLISTQNYMHAAVQRMAIIAPVSLQLGAGVDSGDVASQCHSQAW